MSRPWWPEKKNEFVQTFYQIKQCYVHKLLDFYFTREQLRIQFLSRTFIIEMARWIPGFFKFHFDWILFQIILEHFDKIIMNDIPEPTHQRPSSHLD